MARYIPQPAYPDRMPVDISFVFASERPAGKHGFVLADGDALRFEDGTPARFWGVNFNGGACFPPKDYSPRVARRLAQAGCNLVRFHQLDAEFDTPNIFAFTKGPRVASTRALDPESMDRLDYLISCLKAEGIYCYLDMITYRRFKTGDGVPQSAYLADAGKPYVYTNRRLIELQKEYATELWTHYNPYTKLKYADDPVFALTEITNECDLFSTAGFKNSAKATDYVAEFRRLFRDYLEAHDLSYDWENCELTVRDPEMISFKIERMRLFFAEMHAALRSAGCRIPIAGTNWTSLSANVLAHSDMDFTDSHHYLYDWQWGHTVRICENRALTRQSSVFPDLAKMKCAGRPFFVSEWDMPWPNIYRAEGPIYYAAVGALQGWSGFAIHTYAYGTDLAEMKVLGREQSSPVGGIPYREGIFSVWNDPAKFGLFYHSALILRRGDVSPARQKLAVRASELAATRTEALAANLEVHRCATVFENALPEGYDALIDETDGDASSLLLSDNGELWRNVEAGVGAVDTSRTQIVYGSLRKPCAAPGAEQPAEGIRLSDLTVNAVSEQGVIALSSLTDAPIAQSDNLLLSAIGQARNTDARFDGNRMEELGHPPILAEVITADIHLKTERGASLKVWGVNPEGYYAGQLPTTYEDGVLSFRIGAEINPACYYLIVED